MQGPKSIQRDLFLKLLNDLEGGRILSYSPQFPESEPIWDKSRFSFGLGCCLFFWHDDLPPMPPSRGHHSFLRLVEFGLLQRQCIFANRTALNQAPSAPAAKAQ